MYLVAFFFLFSLNNTRHHHQRHHHHHHFHSNVKGTGAGRGEEDRGREKRGQRGEGITRCVGMLSTSHTLGGCWRLWCRSRRQTPPGCFLYPWRRSCDSRFPYLESDSCSRTVLGCKLLRRHRYWVLEIDGERHTWYSSHTIELLKWHSPHFTLGLNAGNWDPSIRILHNKIILAKIFSISLFLGSVRFMW